jgi:hypothetical protein
MLISEVVLSFFAAIELCDQFLEGLVIAAWPSRVNMESWTSKACIYRAHMRRTLQSINGTLPDILAPGSNRMRGKKTSIQVVQEAHGLQVK